MITKREFLAGGLALSKAASIGSAAYAQSASPAKKRVAKTTKMFKSPPGFPNGLAATPEGLWIGEQKLSGAQAAAYHMAEPKSLSEAAWLVDWQGKLLKTVTTPSRNTSGMAVGVIGGARYLPCVVCRI